jgi:hypothetical protein
MPAATQHDYSLHPVNWTWAMHQEATPEQMAIYNKWWWASVTGTNLEKWMADEKIDADIYERDKEWVH